MKIVNLVALVLRKKSLLIIILSALLVTSLKILHVTIGIDFTGDKLPDLHILKTPSYFGIDLDGDKEAEYVIGEVIESKNTD